MNVLLFTQEEQDNKQMTESSLQAADLPSPHLLSHTVCQDFLPYTKNKGIGFWHGVFPSRDYLNDWKQVIHLG